MMVQIACVPVNDGFLTLIWPGRKDEPPPRGQVRVFHDNVMDLLSDGLLEEPECVNVSEGVTLWQADWKGEL